MYKIVLLLILLLIAVVGVSGYGYANFSQKLQEAGELAEKEKSLRKINVKNSTLSNVTEFIFTKITNQYTYYFDVNYVTWVTKPFGGDKVQIIYEWPYTFSFGIKLPVNWGWCVKVLDDKPGFVQVNSPRPTFISSNPPSPKATKVINGPNYSVNDESVVKKMSELSLKRVQDDADQYLLEDNVKKNITLAFSKHLQDIMNLSHPSSNPVAGVEINYVDQSQCGS